MRNFKKRIVSFVSAIALAATILPGAELFASAADTVLSFNKNSGDFDYESQPNESGKYSGWVHNCEFNKSITSKSDVDFTAGTTYEITLEAAVERDDNKVYHMPTLIIGGDTVGTYPNVAISNKDNPTSTYDNGQWANSYNSTTQCFGYTKKLYYTPSTSGSKTINIATNESNKKDRIHYGTLTIAESDYTVVAEITDFSNFNYNDNTYATFNLDGYSSGKVVVENCSGKTGIQVCLADANRQNQVELINQNNPAGDLEYTFTPAQLATLDTNHTILIKGSSGNYSVGGENVPQAPTSVKVLATGGSAPATDYTVTFSAGANGSVTATAGGNDITSGDTVPAGTSVTFTATPDSGYEFTQWNDGNTTNPRTVTVNANTTMTATFAEPSSEVLIDTLTGNEGGWGKHTIGTVDFSNYTDVRFEMTSTDTQYGFNKFYINNTEYWLGGNMSSLSGTLDGNDSSFHFANVAGQSSVSFAYEGNPGLTVNFYGTRVGGETPTTYTVNFSGTNGSVTATAGGNAISSGASVAAGTSVTFTATPDSGYEFTQWADGNTDNPRTVTVNDNTTMTATFTAVPTTYTVNFSGTNGTVTATAGGNAISSGASVAEGTEVEFTAAPNSGYEFTEWNDGNTTNPRTVTINANTTMTATFTAVPTTYTVNFSGTNGTVTATAGGSPISSGASVAEGTEVTFTAAPDSGYEFTKWNDDNTTNPRTVTVNANTTMTATFTAQSSGEVLITSLTSSESGGGRHTLGTVDFTNYTNVRFEMTSTNTQYGFNRLYINGNDHYFGDTSSRSGKLDGTESYTNVTGLSDVLFEYQGHPTTTITFYGVRVGGGENPVTYPQTVNAIEDNAINSDFTVISGDSLDTDKYFRENNYINVHSKLSAGTRAGLPFYIDDTSADVTYTISVYLKGNGRTYACLFNGATTTEIGDGILVDDSWTKLDSEPAVFTKSGDDFPSVGTYYAGFNATTGGEYINLLKVVVEKSGGGQSDADYEVVGPYRSGDVSVSGTTLTATPRSEYQFVGWYDNEACTGNALSTETTYTYNGTKVYAKFDYVKYNLPIIDIKTSGSNGSFDEAWAGKPKKTKYNGSAITLANSSYNLTESTVQIKGRGNSTWALDKKPYELNFDNAVNLFNQGKAANKTWILLANHGDRTLMRNQLAYTWARNCLDGIPFTTGATPVEVYMNGDYIGMYIVVEKSRVAEGRVQIEETSETTSDMSQIGFLAEWDKLAEKNGEPQEDYYIKTNVAGFSEFFTIHSGVYSEADEVDGKPTDATTSGGNNTNTTAIAIGDYLNTVSAAIMGGDEATIRGYVNMDSFVDMFILQEFTKNPDCGGSSFYMYKNKGANSKLTLGPAWDFDKALGDEIRVTRSTGLYINGGDPESNYNNNNVNTWFQSLYEQQWFKDLVVARWDELRSDPNKNPDNLTDQIDTFVTANSASAGRNYSKWSYDMTHQFDSNVFWGDYGLSGSYFSGKTTFADQTSALKQWITDRIAFLDTEWSGNAVTIDAEDYNSPEFKYNDGSSQPAIPFVVTNSNGDVTEHDIIVTINYTGSGKWVNVFTPVLAKELRDGFGGETATGDADQYGIANSFSELTGGLTIQKHAIQQNGPFTFVIPAGSPTGTYLAGVSGADSFDSITVKYADDDGIQKYEAPVGAALDPAPIFKVNKDAYGYTSKAKAGDTYYVDEKVTAVAREGYMFVNWSIVTSDHEHNESIVPIDQADGFTGVNARNKVLSLTAAMAGRTIYAIFAEKQSIRYEAENFVNLVSEGYVIPKQTLKDQGVPEEEWVEHKMTNAEFYGRTWDNHPTSHPYDAPKVVTDGESVVKQVWDDTFYTDHKIVTSGYSGGKAVALTGPTSGVAIPFTVTEELLDDFTFALGYNYGDMPTNYTNGGGSHWYDNDLYVNVYATSTLTLAQQNALKSKGWSLSEYADTDHASDKILEDAKIDTVSGLQTAFYKRLPIDSLNWKTKHGDDPRENVQETEVTLPAGLPVGKYYISVATDHANLFSDDAAGRKYEDFDAESEGNYTGTGKVGTAYYDYIEFYTASTPDYPSPITVGANFNFVDMFGNSLMTNEFSQATFNEQTSQIQFHPVVPRYLQVQGYKIDYWMYTVNGVTTYVLPDGSTSTSVPTLSDLDSFDTNEEFNKLAEVIEDLAFAQGNTITFTAHYAVKNDVYDMTVAKGRVYVMEDEDDNSPELLPKGNVYKISNYGMVKLVANDDSARDGKFQYWTLNGQIYSYSREVIFSAWCNADFVAVFDPENGEQVVTPAAFISENVQQFGFSDNPEVDQPEYQKVSFDCAFYIPDANNFLSCGILVAPDEGTLNALTSENVTLTEYGTFASGLPTRSATYTAEYDQLFEKANHQVIFSLSGIKRNKHRYARAFYIYKDASGNPQVAFSGSVAHVLTGTPASGD